MKFRKQTSKTSLMTFFIAFALSFFMMSCESDPSKKVNKENVEITEKRLESVVDFAVIDFEKTNHDFGEIKDGDIVETIFTFSNSGNSDLRILNATGSCGCTVPEYPRDVPIGPGETGTIKVKFDSSNKPGMQRKTVTLTTNTSKSKELLNIKAFVLPKN